MNDFSFSQKKNIGLTYVLEQMEPACPYGKDALKNLGPFGPGMESELRTELEYIGVLLESENTDGCRHLLSQMKEIRGTLKRAASAPLTDVDCFELLRFALVSQRLGAALSAISCAHEVQGLMPPDLSAPLRILDPAATGIAAFYLEDTRSKTLAKVRADKREVENRLRYMAEEVAKDGPRAVKKDKDGARAVEEDKDGTKAVKEDKDGARAVEEDKEGTKAVKEDKDGAKAVEEDIDGARAAQKEQLEKERLALAVLEEKEQARLLEEITEALRPHLSLFAAATTAAGHLDLLLEKARLAKKYGAHRPTIIEPIASKKELREDAVSVPALGHSEAPAFGQDEAVSVTPALGQDKSMSVGPSLCVSIINAFLPSIRDQLHADGREFSPIEAELPRGVSVLTGANMGGKSIALKTVALNVWLAASGCYVFADDLSTPLFDGYVLVSEDLTDTVRGLSSFGGEVLRMKEIFADMAQGAFLLLLMDEPARGTNAQEGGAIAAALVRYLANKNAISFIATHYDGAASFGQRHYRVAGLRSMETSDCTVAGGPMDIPDSTETMGSMDITDSTESMGSMDIPDSTKDKDPMANSNSTADPLALIAKNMNYGLLPVEGDAPCPRQALAICRMLGLPADFMDLLD